ncbi:MAG: bifunctional riboflavin kinase/FMN adenylyltransferase [Phycisphaerales bacterium]|nr:bifunctional riboflavin kinase/FMN adenylyltransferase [Phycisphaerales bacterium]
MNVISIGNFDGVHLGHQALARRARELAGDGRVVVVTFEPHPAAILRPGSPLQRLSDPSRRRELLLEAGVDEVRELMPDPELLGSSAEGFIQRLQAELPFEGIVEGADFRFARGRSAGIEELRMLGTRYGFGVEVVEDQLVELEDRSRVRVCSSLVRWLLARGRVVDACTALGRPYRLDGRVVEGDKRGRTIGFPTANLDHGEQLLPADGVYAGLATLPDGERRMAAVSIGRKPTFGNHDRIAEVHMIGHDGPVDDYGWTLQVDLQRWLREQTRFDSVDDLLNRITLDCAEAQRCLQEHLVR